MPVIFKAPEKKSPKGLTKEAKKRAEKQVAKKLNQVVSQNPLSAFLVKPLGVRFAAQEKEEEIVLLLRRHPITNLPWVFFLIILLFIPPTLFPLLTFLKIFPPDLPSSFKLVVTLFWYLGCFGFFLVNFLLWYFNINLVTNERIIDIDFIYLLYKETTATRLSHVEDVTYKMGGIICTLFDFGDVFVHTAGPEQNIEFISVPKPAKITKIIVELMGEEKHES